MVFVCTFWSYCCSHLRTNLFAMMAVNKKNKWIDWEHGQKTFVFLFSLRHWLFGRCARRDSHVTMVILRTSVRRYASVQWSRKFSSSAFLFAHRAIVYTRTGDPATVLSSISVPAPLPPAPNTVNVRFLLSPVNPADINVIEGVYPNKPSPTTSLAVSGLGSVEQPVFVAGNEGLAEITSVGTGVTEYQVGDWVIVTKPQAGTWISSANLAVNDVLKIPQRPGLTQVLGATITVRLSFFAPVLSDYISFTER
jgi:hypothetical protein